MAIEGVLPVLHLPYRDDFSIDFDILGREVDWVFGHGADGIVLALASEIFRLTDAERDELVAKSVSMAAGRGPLVASVGAESIPQAVRHARRACDAGASALMAIPPGMTRCGDSEIRSYFAALLDATPLPVVVQDASGYVGHSLSVDVQADLYRSFPGRVLFKPEGAPIVPLVAALRKATGPEAAIFEGSGGRALLETFPLGVAGTMPGSDVPWALSALWRALRAGDHGRARRIHAPLSALMERLTSLDAFLAVEKMLLVEQGVFRNEIVRGPVACRLNAAARADVLRLFGELNRAVEAS